MKAILAASLAMALCGLTSVVGAEQQASDRPTILVTGTAKIEIPPTFALINVAVSTVDKTLGSAKAKRQQDRRRCFHWCRALASPRRTLQPAKYR